MIDLNGSDYAGGNAIFNNGVAGLVKDVEIKVEKRAADVPETYPDYKLEVIDDQGGKINAGFYYFTPNSSSSDEYNLKREKQEVSRVLHIARAVVGNDYKFPEVKSSREAIDMLFNLVRKNADSKKFNVFATYGTLSRPNKKGYMGLRYFNFIEPATENSKFRVGPQDLMERIDPDAPTTESSDSSESWV